MQKTKKNIKIMVTSPCAKMAAHDEVTIPTGLMVTSPCAAGQSALIVVNGFVDQSALIVGQVIIAFTTLASYILSMLYPLQP